MRRWIPIIAVATAVWLAWTLGPRLMRRPPRHTVEVENAADTDMLHLRLNVAGREFEEDTLRAGRTVAWDLAVRRESDLRLTWEWRDRPGDVSWSGGRVTRGPLVQRHHLRVDDEGGVVYVAAPKRAARRR